MCWSEWMPPVRTTTTRWCARVRAAGRSSLPHIVGSDIAGCVEALGAGVESVRLGDREIVAPGFPTDPAEWDVSAGERGAELLPDRHRWLGRLRAIHARSRAMAAAARRRTDLARRSWRRIPLVLVTAVHAVKTMGKCRPGKPRAGAGGCVGQRQHGDPGCASALGARRHRYGQHATQGEACQIDGRRRGRALSRSRRSAAARGWAGTDRHRVVIDPVGGTTMRPISDACRPRGDRGELRPERQVPRRRSRIYIRSSTRSGSSAPGWAAWTD